MKAAVLKEFGKAPVYGDFPDPVPTGPDQLLIYIRAAAIKNIDRLRAGGHHYASHSALPAVVGNDGIGELADGRMVYAHGLTGMIAEKALIPAKGYTALPKHIDIALAAALPNAVLGAAMALRTRAQIKNGDTVLINGATGVTGMLAVQMAKYYGAGEVVVTGRNGEKLNQLKGLGATRLIPLHKRITQ